MTRLMTLQMRLQKPPSTRPLFIATLFWKSCSMHIQIKRRREGGVFTKAWWNEANPYVVFVWTLDTRIKWNVHSYLRFLFRYEKNPNQYFGCINISKKILKMITWRHLESEPRIRWTFGTNNNSSTTRDKIIDLNLFVCYI